MTIPAGDLTVNQLAALLHIHRNTVLKLHHRGTLVGYQAGTTPNAALRFTAAAVAAFRQRGRDRIPR